MVKFRSIALTILSFGLFLGLASTAHPTPPDTISKNYLSLSRVLNYPSIVALQDDENPKLIQNELSVLTLASNAVLTVTDIARHLEDLDWDVISMETEDEDFYYFVVDPDGTPRKVCITVTTIEIDDGAPSPIILRIESHIEL